MAKVKPLLTHVPGGSARGIVAARPVHDHLHIRSQITYYYAGSSSILSSAVLVNWRQSVTIKSSGEAIEAPSGTRKYHRRRQQGLAHKLGQ